MKCDLEDPCGNCRKVAKECVPAVRQTKPRYVLFSLSDATSYVLGLHMTRLSNCRAKSTISKTFYVLSQEPSPEMQPRHSVHGVTPARRTHMSAAAVVKRTPTRPSMRRLVTKAMTRLAQLSTLLLATNTSTTPLGRLSPMIES